MIRPIVSEIEGIVKMGSRKRGSQEIMVTSKDGSDTKNVSHPAFQAYPGSGERLCEGGAGESLSPDGQILPQDILNILGPFAVQSYLVNEIQEVYRLQGVKINDKHIEIHRSYHDAEG